jgi:hypothetical protein
MRMGFGVFFGYPQIKYMGIKYDPIIGYFEIIDLVVFFGIDHVLFVGSQSFSQMHIIRITAQALWAVGADFDGALLNFFENSAVGENHSGIFG